MYDLTIFCLMRDSMGYMDRFISQVNSAFAHFERCHLVITEGDSVDGTKERIAQLATDGDTTVNGDVTVVELNMQNARWPGNANHPNRWYALETAWNTNIQQLEPTRYAVCVESDLIWDWPVLEKMIQHLEAGVGDVVLPLLMRDTPQTGVYFYDTNAFRLNGVNFANQAPYHPEWRDDAEFMRLDTGGGMLVMRGETLSKAVWKKQCVLHYAEGTHVVCDVRERIMHP
jgi:hypothetical protein